MKKEKLKNAWPVQLLAWYRSQGRTLPWRENKDPYRIWVSEVMLQQTRVEAVKDYYARWMRRFPSMGELAAADETEVLKYWQGLGYYSRARNLLKGVREVQAAYNGELPKEREEILRVPGIGDYTAGAILSIAYDQPQAAIDGNVLRVFSRIYALADDVGKASVKKRIADLVLEVMPRDCPGDFNQALMDLGAVICIPKAPRCESCPVVECCEGCRQGLQRQLPLKKAKKAPLPVAVAVAALRNRAGEFLLHCRAKQGILAGMWEFPAAEGVDWAAAQAALEARLSAWGFKVELAQEVQKLTHTFSHRQWQMTVYATETVERKELAAKSLCWRKMSDWQQVIWAGPHAKIAQEIRESEGI
ncbi:A/G-specific adenine glycosylase [Azotosporobacter soli]|uniref:A/G-specific adenine glycosylase n=1 Tax=Azotosporobacter soli TaxID=3055040 RepID=UPI0031FF279E